MSAEPDSSKALRELQEGDLVEIVEPVTPHDGQHVRGRLQAGGWMSITDKATGYTWAEPDRPEASKPLQYRVVQPVAGVSANPEPDIHKPVRTLQHGDLIDIAEVWHMPAAKRVRGRLVGGGWISIYNTETGHAWAQLEAKATTHFSNWWAWALAGGVPSGGVPSGRPPAPTQGGLPSTPTVIWEPTTMAGRFNQLIRQAMAEQRR